MKICNRKNASIIAGLFLKGINMNNNYIWKSKLGLDIKNFIALKKANGFLYNAEEYQLTRFDSLCYKHKNMDSTVLTRELVEQWSKQLPNESKNTRNYRVSYVRVFANYLLAIGKEAYIPVAKGSYVKSLVYVPSFKEVEMFFNVVDNYKSIKDYENRERFELIYPVLFRLLYCCGLRNSEGSFLKRKLIDLKKGIITIIKSKGQKDRIVYIASDLLKLCKEYDARMNRLVPNREYFFPGGVENKPITRATVAIRFHKFWSIAFPKWSNRWPTPHSLRHGFVVRRMTLWIQEGIDLNVMMPYLSKYLGHSNPQETYYYYHHMESIFPIIKHLDKHSQFIIPEVPYYEK